MFRSKIRKLNFPQSEHLKLAGTLAFLWGNADFDLPEMEQRSFVAGVGIHDRGYGFLDTTSVGEVSEPDWIELTRHGFYTPWSDPVADMVARHHLVRLASHGDSPARMQLTHEFRTQIEQQLRRTGLEPALFQRADRITKFCDDIAFDFCFELPASGEVKVLPRNTQDDEVTIRYAIQDGTISVSPWPFRVSEYESYIIAYAADGYPETLDPVIVPWRLVRQSSTIGIP